ncbi:MacB family efflux pump subunit [Pseudaeromonas sharmana]|uniref:Pyoverdine export ATP-binding/permease protein PvdT n=1 Tax=Pseudaeromonas sharmana TaxID=328412 RepID=A0ABV8CPR2_9GAMM
MNQSVPVLQLSQVNRSFVAGDEHVTVLQQIDLTIQRGEMVAIIGASGSGKSTLMNILGCLDRPTSGEYRIHGQATSALDADALAALRRHNFGFIFQRYHLLPHLDALGNVEMPAIYAGGDATLRRERAASLLTRLGLGDRLGHRPAQLSGGQQQRVSIARALMNGGEVILADEPTGALDSRSGQEVMTILKELHAAGHTVILVTHDAQVAAHAERVIEIHDGRIIADRRQTQAVPSRHESGSFVAKEPDWRARLAQFVSALQMAGIAMAAHRMRTLLTMLGIIIGIMAVVSVVALGQGAQQKVVSDISSMGTNTIDIYPGKDWGDERAGAIQTLAPADLEALQAQIYTDSVTPTLGSSKLLRHGNISATGTVQGVGEQFFRVRGYTVALGTLFNQADVDAHAQVVVIDDNTRKKFFPHGENPLGAVLLLGTLPCRIVGVTAAKESPFGNSDTLNVWIPYTSAMSRILGQYYFSSITLRVRDGMSNAIAEQGIERLLTQRHGSKDFFLNSSDSILKTIQKTTGTLALLISAIAVISLLVGGIGVMNIMLVSVTERTREIGIRMAVGARQSDIMQQFLIEAVLVCLCGGTLGVLLSFGIGALFAMLVSSMSMIFSISTILTAVTCSSLIGVIFGFVPARNAARLDPIEALARE